jgi:hypothetical protein
MPVFAVNEEVGLSPATGIGQRAGGTAVASRRSGKSIDFTAV